jgi:hypothetical protein
MQGSSIVLVALLCAGLVLEGCGRRRAGGGGGGDDDDIGGGDDDDDVATGGTGSGVPRNLALPELTSAQLEDLCQWSADQYDQEETQCGDFTVTAPTAQECIDDFGTADCAATVGDVEDCLFEVGPDPCVIVEGIPEPCAVFFECAAVDPGV